MFRYRLSDTAQEDVLDILAWPELGAGVRSWHLRLSRELAATNGCFGHLEPERSRPEHRARYRVAFTCAAPGDEVRPLA
jgi:plasmid stabilization system protein ParE